MKKFVKVELVPSGHMTGDGTYTSTDVWQVVIKIGPGAEFNVGPTWRTRLCADIYRTLLLEALKTITTKTNTP